MPEELEGGGDVADGGQWRVRRLDGDDMDALAARLQLVGGGGHDRRGLRRPRVGHLNEAQLRADDLVEQPVALERLVARAAREEDRPQPGLAGRRRRHPQVVGVNAGGRHHDRRAGRRGRAEQIFQRARLVAAQRQAGQVIPLDQQARPADGGGEARRLLQRRWQMGEAEARQASERHPDGPRRRATASRSDISREIGARGGNPVGRQARPGTNVRQGASRQRPSESS